jgi:PAS domain S-box-containing protein
MLGLAFVFVRLKDPAGGPTVDLARVGRPLGPNTGAPEIGEMLDASFGAEPSRWPPSARLPVGGDDVCLASARLGLQAEFGVVVAACRRPDFPAPTERLLFDVAANHAAVGLHQAHRLREQRRVAGELDARVARRTRELVALNEELAREVAERRRAEAAARESERAFRLIVDSVPGMFALLTTSGEVDAVNGPLLEYSGQTLEELRGWGTNGTIHPDDLPHVTEVFSRSIAAGAPYEIEQRIRRSDGAYRWLQNNGFPVRGTDGRVSRWCVLLTDIDDRKRAEDALRRSERNLKLIIDTMPALVWSTTPEGAADFFNQLYLEYVGFSADQARGWGWTAAIHPDDTNGLAATWQRSLAAGVPGEAEARMRRHDGEYRWFLFRANPLRDESGAIVKWYGVNADIEDRKRAEAELRRAYDSFADAQRLSHTGNFVADILADEHVWSEELYRIFELDPATKVTVQAVREVVHPDDLPAFDAGFARSLGGADFDLVFRIVTQTGREKHVRSLARLVERVAGRPLFVGAIQDVTETAVAEQALDRARAELAHVARVSTLSALTASIAHEVNQPLSGIVTNAGTCLRMLDADPPNVDGARETARRMIRDGHRAADVITRLRALFAKREFTLEPVDLNEAIEEVVALSLGDLQRARVVLRAELDDGLPPVIGDRVQLQQVVLNLLLNAAEAMREVDDRARDLTIRTEVEGGDRARVTVRDVGAGVDPRSAEKIFDAFYTTKSAGMGIGLSVSRSIIERHHGRLWLEPNSGPGAAFAFSVPCHRQDAAEGASAVRRS